MGQFRFAVYGIGFCGVFALSVGLGMWVSTQMVKSPTSDAESITEKTIDAAVTAPVTLNPLDNRQIPEGVMVEVIDSSSKLRIDTNIAALSRLMDETGMLAKVQYGARARVIVIEITDTVYESIGYSGLDGKVYQGSESEVVGEVMNIRIGFGDTLMVEVGEADVAKFMNLALLSSIKDQIYKDSPEEAVAVWGRMFGIDEDRSMANLKAYPFTVEWE